MVLQILLFISDTQIITNSLLVWKLRQAPNECLNAQICVFAQLIESLTLDFILQQNLWHKAETSLFC